MSYRVLIMESDFQTLRLLTESLTYAGFEVVCATNGVEGLLRAEQALLDLVLIERELPFGEGTTVCRQLRSKGVSAPILVLSKESAVQAKVLSLNAGADAFLTKP